VIERALPDVHEEELGEAREHAAKPALERRAAVERRVQQAEERGAGADGEVGGAEQRAERERVVGEEEERRVVETRPVDRRGQHVRLAVADRSRVVPARAGTTRPVVSRERVRALAASLVVLSLIAAAVPCPAAQGAADASFLDWLYMEPNEGGSSAGHVAVALGDRSYAYQRSPEGWLVLERDDLEHIFLEVTRGELQ